MTEIKAKEVLATGTAPIGSYVCFEDCGDWLEKLNTIGKVCQVLEKAGLEISEDCIVSKKSASIKITDSDIATIEALHDLLLENYKLDCPPLKKARELTAKMYNALNPTT